LINIVKEQQGEALVVFMKGSIEESVNFEELIGQVPTQLRVNCKGISRINSVGVKAWIKYFSGLQANGVNLTFYECSTAIVEQINLISNFSCGGKVESIFVPFSCGSCNSELVGLFTADQIKQLNFEIPNLKCTKCGQDAAFDDIPEEYFGFLMG